MSKLNSVVLLFVIFISFGCHSDQLANPASMSDITVATTYDPQINIPQKGFYAFIGMALEQENLNSESAQIQKRITTALGGELKAKGYKPYKNGKMDLLIDYTVVAQHSINIFAERTEADGSEWLSVVGVPDKFIEGAVVVDIINPKTLKPIWRGVVNANVATTPASEAEKEARAKYAMQQLMKTFPPN